jgi:hypothetical protein
MKSGENDTIFCENTILNETINDVKNSLNNNGAYLSEADFQFSFAQSLAKNKDIKNTIILEYPIMRKTLYEKACNECKNSLKGKDRSFIDLYFKHGEEEYFIEFKYKLEEILKDNEPYKICRHKECGDEFTIKHQGAVYIGRHEIYEDIERMENLKKIKPNAKTFVVLVTNDHLYWDKGKTRDKEDNPKSSTYNFPLSDKNNNKTKCCKNNEGLVYNTSSNSKPRTLYINNSYELKWNNFIEIGKDENVKNGLFRILIIDCNKHV